jgi:hypothetical protein
VNRNPLVNDSCTNHLRLKPDDVDAMWT